MPPSLNRLYTPVGKGHNVKSKIYREYEDICREWMYRQGYRLNEPRKQLKQLRQGMALYIDRCYRVQRKNLIDQNGNLLKNDTSNRIKALDDCVAQILHIDDHWFLDGSHTRRPVPRDDLPDYVDVTIRSIPVEF